MTPLRSHASVRSYYFREQVATAVYPGRLSLDTFRIFWRRADVKAREWRRQATNRWNDQTKRWEQR